MFKRILSVLIALLFVFSLVGCNPNTDTPVAESGNTLPAEIERTYTTLYSDNDALMYANPNRGFRGYIEVVDFNLTQSELETKISGLMNRHTQYAHTTVAVCYIYPFDYLGKQFDQKFFDVLQWTFDWGRKNNIQYCFRFAYWHDAYYQVKTASTEEILSHVDQIQKSGIIEKNKDVIHSFQAGFVGKYGEWHSETELTDHKAILENIVEKLIPEDIYGQVRKPEYERLLDEDNPRRAGLGYHMDSFFGIQDSSQYGSGTFSLGLEDWTHAVKDGAYSPQDGELYFHGQFVNDLGFFPEAYACLLGLSQLRMTTFSSENGYLEQGVFGKSAMHQWQAKPITEKWCIENGIPYSENWFKNQKGELVERSVFDFIKDYLGYRITATKLTTKLENSKLKVALDIENHGFSAAFNIKSSLVLLDKDGNVVSEAAAGEPSVWHPTDPDDYSKRDQLVHSISAELTLPETAGEYRLAFRLESKNGTTARLDNNIEYVNGYNILHTFGTN